MGRFSATLMEHYESPCNRGAMPSPDATGRASVLGNPPFVTIFLRVERDRVKQAAFEAAGCGVTIACASMMTELVREKSVVECRALSVDGLIRAVDGLPPDKRHSAEVVVAALQGALAQLATKPAATAQYPAKPVEMGDD